MSVPLISTKVLANGDTMYYGRQLMVIPQGGASVRQCAFVVPGLHIEQDASGACTPFVSATVDNQGVGAGTIMGIYSVKVVPSGTNTEIGISAVGGGALEGDYFCSVVVIGKPVKAVAASA